ncbi:UDP-N-acetylglucosamine 2-epimerase (non-hydrolyzing) [Candidatus Pelagibacter bacterium]|nr:UDP-N-acetylglucosamine 2-epimerase (non-hydrolyzing) [Candidatus Pelagibacter bacterium]MDA8837390.1 UDP-N-acetylglucosamine 2-epimerase (non-hydrolyzing) [Candidatus Pelagibacter bacterium]
MNREICLIFGTRPEIIKVAPIIDHLSKKKIPFTTIHSGQHYDKSMSDIFFEELKLSKPNYNLNLGKKKKNDNFIFSLVNKVEKILIKIRPKIVIVQGDTNTSLGGAIAVKRANNFLINKIKLAHVESGLRSYDYRMPEELNRLLIDHMSDILFPPTIIQSKILIDEGIPNKKIFIVGSTIADSLKMMKLKKSKDTNTILLTIHRHENTQNKKMVISIIENINKIALKNNYKIIFFCHPKTLKVLNRYKIMLNNKIILKKPTSYKLFLEEIIKSKIIISDSGGIQEEACILKKNLITIRKSTERPETELIGSNFVSLDFSKIQRRIDYLKKQKPKWKSPYGKNVTKKILSILIKESL